ncbi:acetyl-coenzyme A synthetase, cytoplasmic-like [Scomber japonicus]|uniref:acetyl-coenzyme A synthetase, cytoplasmic-like n=1 Tax=Scomber japonicus TaxID=13676 RepID=UPI002306C559|nr:acetyl-coenzyme A synthetase, cytoplasmic-like [Scomber japonicus]
MIPDKAPKEDVFHGSEELKKEAHIPSFEKYKELYMKSIDHPDEFWGDVAKDFFWKTKHTGPFLEYNFDVTKGEIYVKFMEGATTNICYNLLDRNVHDRKLGDNVAFYCTFQKHLSAPQRYQYESISNRRRFKAASSSTEQIELDRKSDTETAQRETDREGKEKTRPVPQVPWDPEVDLCWHSLIRGASDECEPEWCESEDPLFILYTSGSTGKPKGVLHTVSGYMLYTATTFKLVFDHQPGDVYWCTADIGWITGHSYITYGPLANGATSVLFEGLPTYPDVGRMWEIVDKYSVTKFYTAPTAIRMLMKFGSDPVVKYKRESLKVLGTVGEPINPEAWQWYYNVVGDKRCPIVDTFWQTETGGHVLTPLPAATPMKPGSATFPFFGVVPAILNESGEELEGPSEGYLVFKQPWPGVMRTVYGNQQRFETTYFKKFPGYYVTGDGCRRDKDGYYWITGRIDDMLNVSGHLLSTAEVESALVEHEAVAEAAVVGRPHPVKGESLYCFVTLNDGVTYNRPLEAELKKQVREKIGAIATPDYIQNAPGLPKTRSGKIMRRVLRKIACDERDLGDISTLADSSVVEQLFQNRCCPAV